MNIEELLDEKMREYRLLSESNGDSARMAELKAEIDDLWNDVCNGYN